MPPEISYHVVITSFCRTELSLILLKNQLLILMSIAQNMSNQNFGHGDLESRKINQHTSKVLKTPLRKNGKHKLQVNIGIAINSFKKSVAKYG